MLWFYAPVVRENTKNSHREGLKTIVLFLLLRAPVYGKFKTFPVQQGLKTIVGDKIIHNSILLLEISTPFKRKKGLKYKCIWVVLGGIHEVIVKKNCQPHMATFKT